MPVSDAGTVAVSPAGPAPKFTNSTRRRVSAPGKPSPDAQHRLAHERPVPETLAMSALAGALALCGPVLDILRMRWCPAFRYRLKTEVR